MTFQLLTEEQASVLLSVGERTLQRYRQQGILQQGIHWQKMPGGDVRYIQPMLEDWAVNLHDPEAHQRAIEMWRSQMLSNRKRRKS
jgi:hypothetical protein